jgi:uncharacterized protein (DUF885 family)
MLGLDLRYSRGAVICGIHDVGGNETVKETVRPEYLDAFVSGWACGFDDRVVAARGDCWSEEEAVQYFMDNSPRAEGSIRSEVQRYLSDPGQATAYDDRNDEDSGATGAGP